MAVERRRASELARGHYTRHRAKFEAALAREQVDEATRLRCLETDLLPHRLAFYDLDRWDLSLFVSDVERDITFHINGHYRTVLIDKFLFTQLISGMASAPPVLAIYSEGVLLYEHPSYRTLLQSPERMPLFARPLRASGGRGAERIWAKRGQIYLRKQWYTPEDYSARHRRDAFLITPHLVQHESLAALNRNTVNTVRLLTIRDVATQQPRAVVAVARVGSQATYPVDNFSRGGIAFDVEMETGTLGRGVTKAHVARGETWVENHPDSGERITGRVLPRWQELTAFCVGLHRQMPYLHYIGWDICIGPESFHVVEANNTTDVDLLQAHRPLLLDPALKAFYEHHHVM